LRRILIWHPQSSPPSQKLSSIPVFRQITHLQHHFGPPTLGRTLGALQEGTPLRSRPHSGGIDIVKVDTFRIFLNILPVHSPLRVHPAGVIHFPFSPTLVASLCTASKRRLDGFLTGTYVLV
jgi:hypothetical protein